MAALTPAVPDKTEILALVETVLSWDLNGPHLPAVDDALNITERIAGYGRIVAADLRTQCLSIASDSEARRGAQVTLGEAARRLNSKPLAPSAPSGRPRAAHRTSPASSKDCKAPPMRSEKNESVPGHDYPPVELDDERPTKSVLPVGR